MTEEEINELKGTDKILYLTACLIDNLYNSGKGKQAAAQYLLPINVSILELRLIRQFALASGLVERVIIPNYDDEENYDTLELRLNSKGILVMMEYKSYLKYRQSFGQYLFRFWYTFFRPIGSVFNIGWEAFGKILTPINTLIAILATSVATVLSIRQDHKDKTMEHISQENIYFQRKVDSLNNYINQQQKQLQKTLLIKNDEK